MFSILEGLLDVNSGPQVVECGEAENLLWWICTDCILKACISGMGDKCMEWTVNEVTKNVGWRAETRIPEGAVGVLMVHERPMLEPSAVGHGMS